REIELSKLACVTQHAALPIQLELLHLVGRAVAEVDQAPHDLDDLPIGQALRGLPGVGQRRVRRSDRPIVRLVVPVIGHFVELEAPACDEFHDPIWKSNMAISWKSTKIEIRLGIAQRVLRPKSACRGTGRRPSPWPQRSRDPARKRRRLAAWPRTAPSSG